MLPCVTCIVAMNWYFALSKLSALLAAIGIGIGRGGLELKFVSFVECRRLRLLLPVWMTKACQVMSMDMVSHLSLQVRMLALLHAVLLSSGLIEFGNCSIFKMKCENSNKFCCHLFTFKIMFTLKLYLLLWAIESFCALEKPGVQYHEICSFKKSVIFC